MSKNSVILGSKQKQDDEFYTLFEDIAAELPSYKDQLKGKRILCPCDWDESYNEEIVYSAEEEIPGYSLLDHAKKVCLEDIGNSEVKPVLTLDGNFNPVHLIGDCFSIKIMFQHYHRKSP